MRTGIRTIIRLLLMLLLLAAIVPFALPLKDGRPLLSLAELRLPELPSLSGITLPTLHTPGAETPSGQRVEPVIIYRWRGVDGSWQFSDTAPPAGVEYESVAVQPNANLIQGVEAAKGAVAPESEGNIVPPAQSLPLTLSPEQIGELFDKARGVQQLMNERQAQQEAASR